MATIAAMACALPVICDTMDASTSTSKFGMVGTRLANTSALIRIGSSVPISSEASCRLNAEFVINVPALIAPRKEAGLSVLPRSAARPTYVSETE